MDWVSADMYATCSDCGRRGKRGGHIRRYVRVSARSKQIDEQDMCYPCFEARAERVSRMNGERLIDRVAV